MTEASSRGTQHFRGIVPAMATPFTDDGKMDEPRIRELINWYVDSGVHGISVAGSQGEFFSLEEHEHIRLIEVAAETIAGRVPLYAGTGGVTTACALRLTKAAQAIGADLALIITPYFIQPSQHELIAHYQSIAGSTTLPVMLYNNPPRTSVNILPTTLAQCMNAAPNIVGVKDSSGDVTQAIEYKLLTDGKALLFGGRDTITLSLLTHGAEGSISPAANVFPTLMVSLYDAFVQGNITEAKRISDVLAPLRAAWALASFPVVIKEAMAIAGHSAGPTRAPIQGLNPASRQTLQQVISTIQGAC